MMRLACGRFSVLNKLRAAPGIDYNIPIELRVTNMCRCVLLYVWWCWFRRCRSLYMSIILISRLLCLWLYIKLTLYETMAWCLSWSIVCADILEQASRFSYIHCIVRKRSHHIRLVEIGCKVWCKCYFDDVNGLWCFYRYLIISLW